MSDKTTSPQTAAVLAMASWRLPGQRLLSFGTRLLLVFYIYKPIEKDILHPNKQASGLSLGESSPRF